MATRFRITAEGTAPAVSPALQTYTHNAPATVRRVLKTSDSSTLATTAYNPDAGDHAVAGNSLHGQLVSREMVAGITFANGETIKGCVQCLEAHVSNNLNLELYVAIVSSDGGTVRRVLFGLAEANATELANSLTARFFSVTQSGANYTTVAGDRLVVEFSFEGTPTSGGGTNSHNASMRWGGNGSSGDLPENDTETGTTFNPWIEVAPSGLFETTVTPATANLVITTYAPTVSTPRVCTPPTANLVITTYAPTVTTGGGGVTVTPDTAHLVITGYAPSVLTPVVATPTTANLTISTYAPSVTIGKLVIPATANLVITGYAPTVSTPRVVTPPTANLVITGYAPTVGVGVTVTPGTASLVLTTYAPTVIAGRKLYWWVRIA